MIAGSGTPQNENDAKKEGARDVNEKTPKPRARIRARRHRRRFR